jgi:hypothetical protein
MLPAIVEPATADSERYVLVFSKTDSITTFLLPVRPSVRASLVTPQFSNRFCDILVYSL